MFRASCCSFIWVPLIMRFWSELGSSFLSCYPSYWTEKKFHSEEDPSLSQMFKFLTKWHTLRQKQARLTHGDVLESACIDDPEFTNGCAIRWHTYEVSSVQRMQFSTSLNTLVQDKIKFKYVEGKEQEWKPNLIISCPPF